MIELATVLPDDVIASVEKWLIDNWPDTSVKFIPSGADSPRSFTGTLPTKWVESQWISIQERQERRASEEWADIDFRLVCYTRSTDRLASSKLSGQFKELLRNAKITVTDRTDGSTAVGAVIVTSVGIVPPQKDDADRLVSVVDVVGWAFTS